MTRSVPRPRGYFDNILKSPLLNFANYPQSIVRRIASRGGTNNQNHRDKLIKRGLMNNNLFISSNNEITKSQESIDNS